MCFEESRIPEDVYLEQYWRQFVRIVFKMNSSEGKISSPLTDSTGLKLNKKSLKNMLKDSIWTEISLLWVQDCNNLKLSCFPVFITCIFRLFDGCFECDCTIARRSLNSSCRKRTKFIWNKNTILIDLFLDYFNF